MALIRIGDFFQEISIRCGKSNLSPNDVSGVNIDKELFSPSKQVGSDTKNYLAAHESVARKSP